MDEKRLRALIQKYPEKNGMIDIDSQIYVNGMDVSVNTDILIESIYSVPLSARRSTNHPHPISWLFEG